jgi:hypothetical protein
MARRGNEATPRRIICPAALPLVAVHGLARCFSIIRSMSTLLNVFNGLPYSLDD